MSPSGNTLRNYCNNFPGLVGNTTIDWIFPWPEEALMSVARVALKENRIIPTDYIEPIQEHIVYVHSTLNNYVQSFQQCLKREVYVTPKHYLDYITSYNNLLGENHIQRSDMTIKRLTWPLVSQLQKINPFSISASGYKLA